MDRLLIIDGPNRGVSYELGQRVRIGRLGENEIQVADPNVSRIHAEIIRTGDDLVLYDRGSKNGVMVNQQLVAEHTLVRGDEIVIGGATFIFNGPVEIQNARYSCTPVLFLPEKEAEAAIADFDETHPSLNPKLSGCLAQLPAILTRYSAGDPMVLAELCNGIRSCFAVDHAVLLWRDYPAGELRPVEASPRRKSVFANRQFLQKAADEQKLLVVGQEYDGNVLQPYLTSDERDSAGSEKGEVRWLLAPIQVEEFTGVLMLTRYGAAGFSAEEVSAAQTAAMFAAFAVQSLRQALVPTPVDTFQNAEQTLAATRSLRTQEIYNSARRSASGDAPILITGETGTGKETLARFIHESSERPGGPFVVVPCAGIAPEDLDRVIFGEETENDGTPGLTLGKLDLAAGGTIFFLEVGELPLDFQPKLLRFIQDRAYSRVNSDCAVMADVKVIASSGIDLAMAVRSGNFREDLWYRLNVVPFHMPPLRERREDIAPLLDCYLAYYSSRFTKRIIGANDGAVALLQKYDWPGNIRELENAVERAVLLADSKVLSISDFSHIDEARRQLNAKSDLERKRDTRPLAEVERQHIIVALKKHNFNQARAAEALGLHRNTLRNKIIEYGIEIPK